MTVIEELEIHDLGVIADATLELGPGFTAITGETGAGKTMVVTALGLLMGERADASAVRSGAKQARVSGVVHRIPARVAELVSDLGGEIEDETVILSRVVNAEGRSRASIGGAGAPAGSLARLSEHLFTVHGQSEQLRLRSAAAQRDTLDNFGGSDVLSLREAYRAAHAERVQTAEKLQRFLNDYDERANEREQLQNELEEISVLDPQANEDVHLAELIARLSNSEALRAAATAACDALASESDDPMRQDAITLVDGAARELERVAAFDPNLAALRETLSGVSFQLADASRELSSYLSDFDQSGPEELAAAHTRYAQLTGAMRRFSCESCTELLALAARAAARLAELEGEGDHPDALRAQLAACSEREQECAEALSRAREAAATRLSAEVTHELHSLALPEATLIVQVQRTRTCGADGQDEVQFLLSPHSGAEPRALAKTASGGELSRVMLAVEVVVAAVSPVPTFVFDEVDAGVGGAAAIEIGRRLARLARTSQVIVVTHLAQVAAFANNHVQVVKDSAGGFTRSSARTLTGDERLAEMARLLSGLSDSQSALEHAAELLQLRAAV